MKDIDAQLMMEAFKEAELEVPPTANAPATAPAPGVTADPTELVNHLSILLKYFKGGTVDPAVKKVLDLVIPLAVQHAAKNNPQQPAAAPAAPAEPQSRVQKLRQARGI